MVALHLDSRSKTYTRADNKETSSGRTVVNIRGKYQFDKLGFFFEIDNVFDQDYQDPTGYPAPPRTYLMGMSYSL
jgi:iron complex outermembrane receptor protein